MFWMFPFEYSAGATLIVYSHYLLKWKKYDQCTWTRSEAEFAWFWEIPSPYKNDKYQNISISK